MIELLHTIEVNGDGELDRNEFGAHVVDTGLARADFSCDDDLQPAAGGIAAAVGFLSVWASWTRATRRNPPLEAAGALEFPVWVPSLQCFAVSHVLLPRSAPEHRAEGYPHHFHHNRDQPRAGQQVTTNVPTPALTSSTRGVTISC
jgi:hypothetical protein